MAPSPSPGSTSAVPEMPITVIALASPPRPRRAVRVGKGPSLRSAKHSVYLPGWPMVAMSPTSDRAPPMLRRVSCSARPMLALARLPGPRQLVPALTPSWRAIGAMHAERHAGRAGGGGDAQQIEIGLEDRLRRGQHDRQLGRPAAGDHALIGDGLGRDVAEHRRHHAVRIRRGRRRRPPSPRGGGGVGGTSGRPSDSSASVRICCAALPARRVIDDRPAAPLAHPAMRTRGDGRAAEGGDEGRMLARAAGHGDVDVLRRARRS